MFYRIFIDSFSCFCLLLYMCFSQFKVVLLQPFTTTTRVVAQGLIITDATLSAGLSPKDSRCCLLISCDFIRSGCYSAMASMFGTPAFGNGVVDGMQIDHAHVLDLMASHYANHAVEHALRNPGHPDAQTRAHYWARVVQMQQALQARF